MALALMAGAGGLRAGVADVPDESAAATAREILPGSGAAGGLVVHLGCGDGALTVAVAAGGKFLVHGLDADAANVERARRALRAKGLTRRASVRQLSANRLPYAENMVNLLIVEAPGAVSAAEIMRVLVPGGAAWRRRDGKWSPTVKPWPAELDEWTHWLHGADGNAVSRDTVAGPPRRMQWVARPLWSRHHHTVPSVTAMVTAGGRMFAIVDEAPAAMGGSAPDKWALVARDAFNGLPLWRKPIPEWGWKAWSTGWTCRFTVPTHIPRRLVAVGDRVYVTLGFNAPLVELDAATGKVLRTFDGTEHTDEILYHDGRLILSLNQGPQRPGVKSDQLRGEIDDPPVKKSVAVISVPLGVMWWKTGDFVGLRSKTGSMERISHLSMCAGGGRVFFVDGDKIVSLALADGSVAWRVARPESPEHKMRYNIRLSDMCSLVYADGVVYLAQLNPAKRVGWREVRGKLHAFSAETGKELWSRQCASWGWGHPADVFVVDGLAWVHDFNNDFVLGLDPATGKVRRKVSNFKAFDNGHHHRCYRNKATTRFMMTSYRGLEFIDWKDGHTDLNHWVRGTCRLGATPANGLIYATPHPCDCYITSKLNGFVALAPASAEAPEGRPAAARLVKGPAYAAIDRKSPIDNSLDWPTYRHDIRRSGSAGAALSHEVKFAWGADTGARPTSCVAVGESVYVAGADSPQALALAAGSGKVRWRFTPGGRVDTPPTVAGGGVYFGSTDGEVYCLRAADGKLAWRFRGAPAERLVGAYDGIESAWPVHGSVLVRDGRVYFAAGRSSFLDGGIFAYALDAGTGKVISQQRIASPYDMTVDKGRDLLAETGILADLLVASGKSIYMRQRRLFGDGDAGKTAIGPLRSSGGLLDDGWSSRTRWYLGDQPVAEYMVFDARSVYAVRARQGISGYGGFFDPGGDGYELFTAELPLVLAGKGKKITKRWSVRLPVRANAMALAGKTLFAAGTPDTMDPAEPWAAYEGKRGGVLMAISTADGKVLAKWPLPAPPVLDGLSIARGRLLVATTDGKVLCFR